MAVAQAKRTTCPRGHAYDLVSGGRRRCRTCNHDRYVSGGYVPRPRRPLVDVLVERIDIDPATGCWIWTGSLASNGYGRYSDTLAHRLIYEIVAGEIPEALCLDHLCRVRRCVCPWHLEPVTLAENVRRGAVARRAGR